MKNAAKIERDSVKFGDATIEYSIVRSRRRRRTIEIKLEPGGGVRVAAPLRASREELRQVVLKRASWIIRKAAEPALQPQPRKFVSGESLPYLGSEVPLFAEGNGLRRVKICFDESGFRVTFPSHLDGEERHTAVEAALVKWYKERAAEHLGQSIARWAELYGHQPTRVLVRDQQWRWGSCSADGTLRFNWRLVLAPPALLDYVVVHELAHLRVKNHSATFWAEVAKLMPDYRLRRSLLKEIGAGLTI